MNWCRPNERRKGIGGHYSGSSVFSSSWFAPIAALVRKVWHSTDKYRKVIWRCNAKFNGEHKCATLHMAEDEIKAMFLKAYNELMGNREHVIADCRPMLEMLADHTKLDAQIRRRMMKSPWFLVWSAPAFMRTLKKHKIRMLSINIITVGSQASESYRAA